MARTRRLFGGIPPWAKPSTFAAGTGVASGIIQLLFTPLSGGTDSFANRMSSGYATYKETGDPQYIFGMQGDGQSAFSILAAQMKQNSVPALITVTGFGIGAALLKKAGL